MRFSLLGGLLAASLLACGSSTSNDTGASDASTPDATSGSSSGGQDSGGGSGDSSEDAGFDAAPVCPGKGTQCESCCDTNFAAGSQKFDQITLQCACAPQYCGGPDGGEDSGSQDAGSFDAGSVDASAEDGGSSDAGSPDAGVYGTGACAATCDGTQAPNAACNTCIRTSLGSESSPGPCGADILAYCATDAVCQPYLQCVVNCE